MSQAAGKFKSSRPDRIFDCFVAVELQHQLGKDNLEHVVPVITYRYPAQSGSPDKKDGTMASIPQFCFPVIDKEPKSKMDKEIFSFVLTESDGARRFGYCRRFLPPGKSVITPLLEAILGSKFPLPGQSFEFPVVSYKQAGAIETLRFTRPNDDESTLDYVNFTPLLQLVTPENILAVFASLLIERRVIFVSERLSTLSNCVQACVALLYPFTWQHVYIPVLPTSLLTMCCAPMPFVVGILSSSLAEVLRLPLDEVLILDIDHNKFILSPGNDVELIPPQDVERLYAVLKYAAKLVKKTALEGLLYRDETQLSKKDSLVLTKEFANFFANLLSEYPHYVTTGEGGEFDRAGFVKASPPEAAPLLQWMLQGQMFERWIEEKRAGGATGGEFELHLSLRRSAGRSAASHDVPLAGETKPVLLAKLLSSASQPNVASDPDRVDVVKKGHLYELGRFKRWEKKWFVLDIKYLTSYATFESPTPSKRISLVDIARVYKADQASGEQTTPDTMIIVELKPPSSNPPSNVTRVQFFLRADTIDETSNWLTVLSTWLESARHSLDVTQPLGRSLTNSHPNPVGAQSVKSSSNSLHASTPSIATDASQPSSFFALPPMTLPNRPIPPVPNKSAPALMSRSTEPGSAPPPAEPVVVESTRKLPARPGPLRPASNVSLQSSSLTHAMVDYPHRDQHSVSLEVNTRMEMRRRDTSAETGPRPDFSAPSKPTAIPRPTPKSSSHSPVPQSQLAAHSPSSQPPLLPRARPPSLKNISVPARTESPPIPMRPLPQVRPAAAKP